MPSSNRGRGSARRAKVAPEPTLTPQGVEPRERAWDDIHSWLHDGWRVTAPSWDPGPQRREVVARSPKPIGRLSQPDYLIGDREDEHRVCSSIVGLTTDQLAAVLTRF